MDKQKEVGLNTLWRIRQTSGLELKQVARLFGYNTTDSISRYEKSNVPPKLHIIVKLMLIYNSNLKEMFPDLFEHCRHEIEATLQKHNFVISLPQREKLAKNINSCTYEEMFDNPNLTENDKVIIHNHLRKLATKYSYL